MSRSSTCRFRGSPWFPWISAEGLSRGARAAVALLATVSPGCDGEVEPAPVDPPPAPVARPAPPARSSHSLLAQLHRSEVLRGAQGEGEPIHVTSRTQPWWDGDRLWFGSPGGGAPVVLRDVPLQEGAELVVGMGLMPGSEPAPAGAGGKYTFRVAIKRDGVRTLVLEHPLELEGRVPGEPVIERVVLPGPSGPADVYLLVRTLDAPEGLSPAWYDVRLEQERVPAPDTVLRVVSREPLLDLADPDGMGSAARASPAPAERRVVDDAQGDLLRQPVPSDAAFLVERTPGARLAFRVVESRDPVREQGDVRFAVRVDGVEVYSEVLMGNPPTPSLRRLASLDAPDGGTTDAPAKVELIARWVDEDHAPDQPADAVWVRPMVERVEAVPRQDRDDGPNVLLVVVDTLRADHLDLYGYERQTAPSLTARAAQGVVFERAMAPSSWTVPSMASLFTGQYAYTHGLYDEYHWMLDPDVPTLAETFREAGLSTVCVMSNPLLDDLNGALRGFEQVESVPVANAAQVNRAFLDWLDAHLDERFFATVHYFDPHDPYAAPGDALGRFLKPDFADRATPSLWKTLQRPVRRTLRNGSEDTGVDDLSDKERSQVARMEELYDSEIVYWDEHFAALLEELSARGALDDTVLLVTSDHGESFAEHGMLGHGRDLHRELIHVPLVLLNSGEAPGRRDELVSLLDIAPTLLRLAGVDGSALGGPPFVGRDLLRAEEPREFLFAQTSHGERVMDGGMLELQAVLTAGGGKALRVAGEEQLEIYETLGDPEEQRPVELGGAVHARLLRALDDWETASRALAGWESGPGALDPDVAAAMRALGYLK
jgi:arylsulfatase A-like enzyme